MLKPPTKKLTAIQRAFEMGFRSGFRKAEARMRAEVDEKVDMLVATNNEVSSELKAMRSEFLRLKAIERGTLAERDPVEHPWLH